MADEHDAPDVGTVVVGGECARCGATDLILNMRAAHLCVRCVSRGIRARLDAQPQAVRSRGPRDVQPTPDARGPHAPKAVNGG